MRHAISSDGFRLFQLRSSSRKKMSPDMFWSASRSVALIVVYISIAVQSLPSPSGSLARRWWPEQINETMCWWKEPRSGVIRDTMYIDGGILSFLAGMANGTYNDDLDQVSRPYLYYINFSEAFNTSQNASDIIRTIKLPPNNLGPNYYDGTMFTNDYELLLYGGLLSLTDSSTPPDSNKALSYEKYQHFTVQRPNWVEDWYGLNLPTNMTRYITQGAGVSVPSENLGFYFSGMRAAGWGEIYRGVNYANSPKAANVSADTLISVDMATMRSEKWANLTLPSQIRGRANAELAWIPVTTQGVLVAIGGVVYPEDMHYPTDQQLEISRTESPGFMKQVAIYDISSQKWYTQDTTGDIPGALTQFCSVVASAKDQSSHSIYIYGGYDGQKDPGYSDDVYVLSVPSFIWTKVYSGTIEHARARHKCSKPYPDQMFVVGGNSRAEFDDPTKCLDIIQIFNLNNLTWQDRYDPNVWSEYKIPPAVVKNIGGNADGGATTTSPTGWGDNALPSLFGAKYTKSITTYYPYKTVSSTSSPRPSVPVPIPGKGGIPVWVAPFLGVVLGLVAVSAIATCFMLRYRTRRRSEQGGGYRSQNIWSWLSTSAPPNNKTPTVMSEDTSVPSSSPFNPSQDPQVNAIPEALSSEVYEMPVSGGMSPLTPRNQVPFTTPSPERAVPVHGTGHPLRRRPLPPNHSHNVSDVSASTEPDRSSPITPPGLAAMPEGIARDVYPMRTSLGSPVSPPVDERWNPLELPGNSYSGVAPPARVYPR